MPLGNFVATIDVRLNEQAHPLLAEAERECALGIAAAGRYDMAQAEVHKDRAAQGVRDHQGQAQPSPVEPLTPPTRGAPAAGLKTTRGAKTITGR